MAVVKHQEVARDTAPWTYRRGGALAVASGVIIQAYRFAVFLIRLYTTSL